MSRKNDFGPYMVPLPPVEREAFVSWLRTAATALNDQMPPLRSYHTKLKMRVGLVEDDEERTLGEIMASVIELLAGEGLVAAAKVADIDLKFDRVIPAGQVQVSIRTALPPRHRIGAETRKKISAACTREARAARGTMAEAAAR